MNFAGSRKCTLIAGVSGSGKTTFALRALVNTPYTCRFIFDPEGEFTARLKLPACRDREDCERRLASRWIILDPDVLWPGRHAEAFEWLCGYAMEASARGEGQKVLMVDEVWRYCTPQAIPQPLATCIQTGRRYGLDVMFATQRPNRLNEAIVNETTELVAFRLQGGNALKIVSDLGANADEIGALPLGRYVARSVVAGTEQRGGLW